MIYFTCIAEGLFCYGTLDYCLSYLMDESLHRISTVTLFGYAKDDGKDEIEIFCCNWKNKLNLSIVEPINYWSSVWLLNKDFKFGQSHRGFFFILPNYSSFSYNTSNFWINGVNMRQPFYKINCFLIVFYYLKENQYLLFFSFFSFFFKKNKKSLVKDRKKFIKNS